MRREEYYQLTDDAIAEKLLTRQRAEQILTDEGVELLPLITSAFEVRKKFKGKDVTIHIINNGQNGHCPEDCHYCAQAKSSEADIEEYALKSDEEFLLEAKNAYEKGAHRYCMVFAGRSPSFKKVERLSRLIKLIKSRYPLEICVSAGLLDYPKAQQLKEAGLDRLNHNLNTSQEFYPQICTTHTYFDRVNTLNAARQAGIQLCSGMIVGMGETVKDIINVAYALREKKVESIPVNFLVPIEGNQIKNPISLSPEFCLRVLCLFRFLNPKAEIRVAAGRELHLRDMEVMALYPANSLFIDGYLNTKGEETLKTLQMIKDAGFNIQSNRFIDDVMRDLKLSVASDDKIDNLSKNLLKNLKDLRPHLTSAPVKKTA